MQRNRGMRKEDRNAEELVRRLEKRANEMVDQLCRELEMSPELILQRRAAAGISDIDWRRFIEVLAKKALSGEHTLHIVNEFNRLFVFPHRKPKLPHSAKH